MATNEPPEGKTAHSLLVQQVNTKWTPDETTVGVTSEQHDELSVQKKILDFLPETPPSISNYYVFEVQCDAYQHLKNRSNDETDPVPLADERIAACKRQSKTSINVRKCQQKRYEDLQAYPVKEENRSKPWPSYVMYEKLLIATNRVIPAVQTRKDGRPDFEQGLSLSFDRSIL